MDNDRKALDIPDLDDFAPRPRQAPAVKDEVRKRVDTQASFPSREASNDGQLNMKGPREVFERFKALCKEERRPYYEMLSIMMDRFDEK